MCIYIFLFTRCFLRKQRPRPSRDDVSPRGSVVTCLNSAPKCLRPTVSANIPLNDLRNEVFESFLEKCTRREIAAVIALRKGCVNEIHVEALNKIRKHCHWQKISSTTTTNKIRTARKIISTVLNVCWTVWWTDSVRFHNPFRENNGALEFRVLGYPANGARIVTQVKYCLIRYWKGE